MNLANGDNRQEASKVLDEQETLHERVANLEQKLADVTQQRDQLKAEVRNYEAMLRCWDEQGIAPPRKRDMEEARKAGMTLDQLIGEIEAAHTGPTEVNDHDAQR